MSKKTKKKKKDRAKQIAQNRAASRAWKRERQEEQEATVQRLFDRHRKLRNIEDLIQHRKTIGTDGLNRAPRSLNVAAQLLNCADAHLPDMVALLRVLSKQRSGLLSSGNNNYTHKLRSVVQYSDLRIRELSAWKPKSKNRTRQFRSLLRHLFAKYDVPFFMDEAWERPEGIAIGTSVTLHPHIQWWFDIAAGKNIRKSARLPIPLSKKMAHHFIQTPEDFGINGAFRWAQVHALGGDERIARGLMETFLGRQIGMGTYGRLAPGEVDRFYESVIRFFIANPMLDTQHYGPILDYLRNQKYVTQRGADGPPQPNLSMKDRQADALLKQVQSWHDRLGSLTKNRSPQQWAHDVLPDWEHIEGKKDNQTRYGVIQLLSAKELQQEGRRLEHCVGSYAWSCANGRTSIWSMRKAQPGGLYTLLGTIEVRKQTDQIVQFRAKRNSSPSPKAYDLLRLWAADSGLSISRWIR